MSESVNSWSRFLGVSLRPWSGDSPASLIVRGLIGAALGIFLAVVTLRMGGLLRTDPGLATAAAEYSWLATVAAVMLLVWAGVGVLRIVVGVLDIVPRRKVTGTVLSVTERKVGDFLPRIAQQLIYERTRDGLHTNDQRKRRTEMVLDTSSGTRQWTVRNHRLRSKLREGSIVTVTVTPLAGYVAAVEQH